MANPKTILWIDDEVEQLKPHIIFLEKKGYKVLTASSAIDGLELIKVHRPDVILLDEMMPAMDGLTAIEEIRKLDKRIPIVMITKSEEENLIEEAMGQQISDYIVKPVHPLQVLTSLKKIFDRDRVVEERLARGYTSEYAETHNLLSVNAEPSQWLDIARWIAEWDIIIDEHPELGLEQMHREFRREANSVFSTFIINNYPNWIFQDLPNRPTLSVDIFKQYLVPWLKEGYKVIFVVIDCMRLDQFLTVERIISEMYETTIGLYYSILPTATPYARNALFSGLFPGDLQKSYPKIWERVVDDPNSCNRYEHELMDRQLDRLGVSVQGQTRYIKILDPQEADNLIKHLNIYLSSPLSAVVVNFLDILAHSRVASNLLKEISPDEAGYRAVMKTWFSQSPILDMFRKLKNRRDVVIIVTTDHGSTIAQRGVKAYGKKDTSPSLRYKFGDNINVDEKGGILIKDPRKWRLPSFSVTTNYLIAKEDYYLVYPTHFNEYEQKYKDSFVHGGISIEEMIVPIAVLNPGD